MRKESKLGVVFGTVHKETTTRAWELCLAQSTKWVPARVQHKPELKAHAAHAVPSSISCTSTPQKTEALSAPEKANVQQVPVKLLA